MKTLTVACPACGSKQVIAKRDGSSWCRHCGWQGKTEETKTNGDKPRKNGKGGQE